MPIPLIRTKLHRPPVAKDHLHRQHLLDRLNQRRHRPLTLVSAPAGYGKSTLVSCWLDSCDCASAWVALDANDSDLRTFLAYFLAAIDSMFSGAVAETRRLLKGADLPALESLAATFINELCEIDQDYILVLDDYHMIREKEIHDLMAALLSHPTASMHLVISTRRDPPLALAEFRARGQMTEVRVQDLRFSSADTTAFIQKVMATEVDPQTAAIIEEKTEGWVAGLRLAVLSLRERADLDRLLAGLPDNNRYVMNYIISEVLSKQPQEVRDYLLSTAILERFCAPLCESICILGNGSKNCSLSGDKYIERLEQHNMFIIPLDDHRRWYRFHHLFRQLLKSELKRQFPKEEINELHNRAGRWFDQNDLPDQALQHFLAAENITAAKELVVTRRYELTAREQWHRLDRWIQALPPGAVGNDPRLLIAKAWLLENRERLPELFSAIERLDRLLSDGKSAPMANEAIAGELAALKSAKYYMQGNAELAKQQASQAIVQIPAHHSSELAYALLVRALIHQLSGETKLAQEIVYDALIHTETDGSTYAARLMLTLCFIDWLEGNLAGVRQNAAQLLSFGRTHDLLESVAFGDYFLGLTAYYQNDTWKSQEHLIAAVKNGRIIDPNTYVQGSFALALTYLHDGQPEKAEQISLEVADYALRVRNTSLLQTVEAFKAELALRQGRLAEAFQWAGEYREDPPGQVVRFFVPQLTLTKTLLTMDTVHSRQHAHDLLERLSTFFSSVHNNHFLIEVLAQKAISNDSSGNQPAALKYLEAALKLALPSRRLLPFLDLGPQMKALLEQLGQAQRFEGYIEELLTALNREEKITVYSISKNQDRRRSILSGENIKPIEDPLTNREHEVLTLLSRRMRNKEIAAKLFIAPDTVKRHTINIYNKLNVHNRKEAVAQAKELGILSGRG